MINSEYSSKNLNSKNGKNSKIVFTKVMLTTKVVDMAKVFKSGLVNQAIFMSNLELFIKMFPSVCLNVFMRKIKPL